MKENNPRILATKQLKQPVIDAAVAANIRIDSIPFISTSPIDSLDLKREIDGYLPAAHIVVFTSAKAVAAVAHYAGNRQPGWHIFCLEGATRKETEKLFPDAKILETAENAASLAAKIIAREIKEVIFFCGDLHLPNLSQALEASGILVKEVIVYKTLLTPIALNEAYDAILFFSPSAVQSFFSVNRIGKDTALFAIGGTTADYLKEYPNPVITSDAPDPESMMRMVISYYLAEKTSVSKKL